MDRLRSFLESKSGEEFLQDIQPDLATSKVEDHVIRNAERGDKARKGSEAAKMKSLKARIKEEKETIFFIVHDEAHFAPQKNNLVDKLINDPDIASAPNVVLLQVSATPYCLVTKNSRVPRANRLDMYKENGEDPDYYGIGQFVEASSGEEADLSELIPGTLTKDEDYETNIGPNSTLREYVTNKFKAHKSNTRMKEKKKNQTSDQNEIDHATRFYGLVCQWIAGLLKRVEINSLESNSDIYIICDTHCVNNKITAKILKEIDSGPDGKGSMVLMRLLYKNEGIFLAKVMKDLRNALGLSEAFSVCLDIDDDKGSKESKEFCEPQFLARLQDWNAGGDPDYRPSSYKDLQDLPVILIVVNKGKMGITYPKSLRYYDLRLRYSTTKGVTRGAIEQDFGRACRYTSPGSDEPPLPTVLVSIAAEQQLKEVRNLRRRRNKPTGVYLLNPDYRNFMVPAERREYPQSDFDLKPYRKWIAGKDHCDNGNTEEFSNRYLLIGRPQIGKTGVFLHLAYLLWQTAGRFRFTGPSHEHAPLVELEESNDKEDEDELEDTSAAESFANMQEFPDLDTLKQSKLAKCEVSARYGDPNNPEVLRWYLEEGMQYPHQSVFRNGKNTIMSRTGPSQKVKPSENENPTPQDATERFLGLQPMLVRASSPFCAKSVMSRREISEGDISAMYEEYEFRNLGILYLRKSEASSKWILPKNECTTPVLRSNLKLPPIITPSYGRAETALLDLSEAMEGRTTYVQVVVVREEEREEYLKTALAHPALDVLVMNCVKHRTIGEARMVSKTFGEIITNGTDMNFIFMLDDNILDWKGITLINDPCPMFGTESKSGTSQRTDISLFNVLSHFSSNSFENISSFSILGFSSGIHKSINRRKRAFSRKHVFGAVLLNLNKIQLVNYNPLAWAMEDVDFNKKTDDISKCQPNDGVIVKCMRYVAVKKKLRVGGVVQQGAPLEVQQLMETHEMWTGLRMQEQNTKVEKSKPKETVPMDELLQKLKAQEQLNEEKDRMMAEKDKEIEHLKAQLAGTLSGSQTPSTASSPPRPGSSVRKKRTSPPEVVEDNVWNLTSALNSELLPEGLVKALDDPSSSKVDCGDISCENCRHIPRPFRHFADHIETKHLCHLCNFYYEDANSEKFKQLTNDLKKVENKKPRKMKK